MQKAFGMRLRNVSVALAAHWAAAVAAAAPLACLGCEDSAMSVPARAPATRLLGDVRENFRHWDELLADPSAAAARTRAAIRWAALDDDAGLLARFRARGEFESALVAGGIADAERAAIAFPDAPDVWTTLARLRGYAGYFKGAADASCRAADASPKDSANAITCVDHLIRADRRQDAFARAKAMLAGMPVEAQTEFRRAMTARDRLLGAAIACEPADAPLGFETQLACGEHLARNDDRRGAYKRYLAAFHEATTRSERFVALHRIEEVRGDCKEELRELPPELAKQYPIWKEMAGSSGSARWPQKPSR